MNKAFVSGEAFDMLGVRPAVGRLFSADEDRIPPGRAFAVLSFEYWKRRFQADPAIVGKSLKIDGQPYEIIGIAREGFFGVEPGVFVDVWLPATQYDPQAFTEPGWHWFRILGRLAPGTSLDQVQARIQPAFHRLQVEQMRLAAIYTRAHSKAIRRKCDSGALCSGWSIQFSKDIFAPFVDCVRGSGRNFVDCVRERGKPATGPIDSPRAGDGNAGLIRGRQNASCPSDVNGKSDAFS